MFSPFLALFICSLVAANVLTEGYESRIIGGENAIQGQFPYQVSLRWGYQFPRNHICGGALVQVGTTQVVVTAASCILDLTNLYELAVGNINIHDHDDGVGQSQSAKSFIIHENYDGRHLNDIALFFLYQPFVLNDQVQPIALPLKNQTTTGDVIVSGWGYGVNPTKSEILQWVQIPSVDDNICREAYNTTSGIHESMMCAGRRGMGSCDGDFGGPVVSVDGKYLAGVFSWGWGCGEYPGVHTEISYFVNWIASKVQSDRIV